ncbi:GNAT family N-acetyltransferase [Cochlodiniinecator piscidefendens]|uniref:GNAT family N-acetyltransferase n=1 Tax=Cochlodiniinecator piscidefendens TaxID=2715756 RepID=UPI00140C3446|nr:GNAT family N-acetyltransferase [Cochlodiniinecator piscidefendens]
MRLETINTQPVVQAETFILRPVQQSDAGLLRMYTSDKRVAETTSSIPHPLPPGATSAFITRATDQNRNEDVWVIDASKSGGSEVIGVISLTAMDRKQSEIGYWTAPAFWGMGYASASVNALLQDNPHGAETIFASVFQDNPASARVLTKSGFEYLGDAETHCVSRNANVPTWTYLKKLI